MGGLDFWMIFNIFAIGIGPNKPLFPTSISASAETRKADTAEKRKNLAERGQFKTDQELAGKKKSPKQNLAGLKKQQALCLGGCGYCP